MPKAVDYTGIAQTWIGPMDWGVDFKDMSTLDYWMAADSAPSFMVREGLGSVVAHFGRDLPVALNTPVTAINWGGNGVTVETDQGTIAAKACIVTVSTGVLQAGHIRFTPSLPDRKQQAIADLPMGLLAKIALQFDGARLGFIPNQWLDYWVPNQMPAKACYFITWPLITIIWSGLSAEISVGSFRVQARQRRSNLPWERSKKWRVVTCAGILSKVT